MESDPSSRQLFAEHVVVEDFYDTEYEGEE